MKGRFSDLLRQYLHARMTVVERDGQVKAWLTVVERDGQVTA